MPRNNTGGPPEMSTNIPDMTLSYEDFEDMSILGQGGKADVYSAVVTGDREPVTVAVKQPRMTNTLHADSMDRFIEEAKVWEALDGHNNIVSLIDWGTDPIPWIAMEYMDGGTLAGRVQPEQLPLDQALWVSLCVCRAVRYAHRHGVAHHDIKPANVLFCQTNSGWMLPKVSDWGLARLMLEESGSIEGLSPNYAAPEQFSPEKYGSPDDFTDIYQVGTLAYYLITGRPPFDGPAPTVMQRVLNDDPRPPSEISDVPPGVDQALMPALQKNKTDRYDTIVYLRDKLQAIFDSVYQETNPTAEPADLETTSEPNEKHESNDRSSTIPPNSKPEKEDGYSNHEQENKVNSQTKEIVDEPDSASENWGEYESSSADQATENHDRFSSPVQSTEVTNKSQPTHEYNTEKNTSPFSIAQIGMLSATFVAYPLLLFFTLSAQFPLNVNLIAGLCVVLIIGFLQSHPRVGVIVFAAWTVLLPPILFFDSDIALVSLQSIVAITAVIFPLSLSALMRVRSTAN